MANPTYHDPASCARPLCGTCEAYHAAYELGKAKLAAEIHGRLQETHFVECACRPCSLIRLVVGALDLEFPALIKLWTR